MTSGKFTGTSSRGTRSTMRRRRFLQAGGAASVAFAGCLGGQDTGSSGGSLDGVEIRYWSKVAKQSKAAEEFVKEQARQFEEETGAKVSVSVMSGVYEARQKWMGAFDNEEWPVLFDEQPWLAGPLWREEWLLTLDEMTERLSDQVVSNVEWTFPTVETAYSGFDVDGFGLPFGLIGLTPMAARRDHFEAAGLDPESDFPPESYDHMIQTAKTLQEDGPADWGLAIIGSSGDVLDSGVSLWATHASGRDGLFLTPDWQDVNFDNDVWKSQFEKYVAAYREHGVSSPRTPTQSDEDTAKALAQGTTSMGWIEQPTLNLLKQAAGESTREKIMFGNKYWDEASGSILLPAHYVTRTPSGVDDSEWERKQEAAFRFIEFAHDQAFQTGLPDGLGFLPVVEEHRESVLGDYRDDHMFQAVDEIAQDTNLTPEGHTRIFDLFFNVGPPHIQRALKGEVAPDEALDNLASEARDMLRDD